MEDQLPADMDPDIPEEEDTGEEDEVITLRFKRKHLQFASVPMAFALGLALGYFMWGQGASAVTGQNSSDVSAPSEVTRYDVPDDGDPSIGPADAPITIIEFSDYQCPYCTRWHQEVFGRLMQNYEGQIRFVYRDLPLTNIHPEALPAAAAANCAREQGAYWEFHEAMFQIGPSGLSANAYLQVAMQLNLDLTSFEQCVDTGRTQQEVLDDMNFALGIGARSTPTFFINGIALVGAQPYEVFVDVIEKELAGEFR